MPSTVISPPTTPLVLLNSSAGGVGDGSDVERSLRARFPRAAILRPGSPSEAVAAVEGRDAACDAVVVGGGDGSVSAVLGPLLEAHLPLGVLPLGTANDFARSLGVADLEDAIDAIAGGRTRTVDVGTCNGRPFLNALAIGLPAAAADALTADLKRRLGMFAAAAVLPRILARGRSFEVTVDDAAGETRVPAAIAVLASARRYVGGVPVRYERLDDGRLYVTVARARSAWEVLSILVSALLRRLPEDWNVTERTSQGCRIRTSRTLDVAVDGDVALATPVEIGVLPHALRVFVPGR